MLKLPLSPCRRSRYLFIVPAALLLALVLAFALGNRERDTYLLLKVAAAQPTTIQIFFDTGNGIEERSSQERGVVAGSIGQLLRFPLPDKPVSSLRIDPGADIRILEISVVDSRNRLIRPLPTSALAALNDIDDLRKMDGGLLVTTKGDDSQLGMALAPRLLNTYGLNPVFALTLFFILYSILWMITSLLCRWFGKAAVGAERPTEKKGRSLLYALHLLALVCGGIAIGGGALLWVWEDKSSLVEDHGNHDLVPYKSDISGEAVTFNRQPDGLPLAARLYRPVDEKNKNQSAVLLMHGNYPQGSAFPLYRLLAVELARRGYVVLAMDFAGYGRSADPFADGGHEGFNLDLDAVAGLEYLRRQPGVAADRIHLTGHSMGADPAISVGSRTDSVRSISLIGPPRRVFERFHQQADLDFFWKWAIHVRQTVYQKKHYPEWFSRERWREQILKRDMVHALPYFSQWSHKPVLFMDGEQETEQDKDFLEYYFCRSSWPKKYVTLNRANHDCNVAARHGQIYYDGAVMEQTVSTLDDWMQRAERGQAQPFALLLNFFRRLFAVEMLTGC